MSPNNHSITATTTTTEETDSCELSRNEILNVRLILLPEKLLTEVESFQRKNKNILNSRDSCKDENGNLTTATKPPEVEYKIEPAWFNIFGFIYLHTVLIQSAYVVEWNKTLAFGKINQVNLIPI